MNGNLIYYTDNSHTTTASVEITTLTEINNLKGNSSWSITIGGVTIANTEIKEVHLANFTSLTTTPNNFLYYCSSLDSLELPNTITSLGVHFLAYCSSFNQPLTFPSLVNVGNWFLSHCSSFNSDISLPEALTTGDGFLGSCTSFDSAVNFPKITEIGRNFMEGCTSFNKTLNLGNTTKILYRFLAECESFNKTITIPSTVQMIGTGFMFNCDSMTNSVICNAPASVISSDNETFSTNDSSAPCYVYGIRIGGAYASEWKSKFPEYHYNNIFRKLVDDAGPVLLETTFPTVSYNLVETSFGVSNWDNTGTYNSGTVKLFKGTTSTPTTLVFTGTQLGLNSYNDNLVDPNTRYYYEVQALNNGNQITEDTVSVITDFAPLVFNSSSNVAYQDYNHFIRRYSVQIQADGGERSHIVEYRMKKDGESDWGDWQTVETYNGSASKNSEVDIVFETESLYYLEFRIRGSSTTLSLTQPSIPTHEGPTNVSFILDDTNETVQNWLSTFPGYNDNVWLISGKSSPRVTIPTHSAGELADETQLYVRSSLCGFSTSAPIVGTILTNIDSIQPGSTIASSTNGYLAIYIGINDDEESIIDEITENLFVADIDNPDTNLFDGSSYLQAYFSDTGGDAGKIITSTIKDRVFYIPCETSKTYRVSYKTTGGISLYEYQATITSPDLGISYIIPYSGNMTHTFDPSSLTSNDNYGIAMVRVGARDSLRGENYYYQAGIYMTWTTPTFAGSVERAGGVGGLKFSFSGTYSGLKVDGLNQGADINKITIEYRVLDYTGAVITDWTAIPRNNISVRQISNSLLDRAYSGTYSVGNVNYVQSIVVEVRASDSLDNAGRFSTPLIAWSEGQKLNYATYELELWDWKTNTFVADISYLVVGDLSLTWELNDVEELSFKLDLKEYEKKCEEMGIDPEELLKPYKHDVRVRRNGEYILGCQIVEANIQIPNNTPVQINVKCTGFLNLFKDQYILDEAWDGYTYGQIARKLIQAAQKPDCLIKNPTLDIDISYWLAANGTIDWANGAPKSNNGKGYIAGSRSGTGWITYGTQMSCDAGTDIVIDMWVRGQAGTMVYIRERKYITQYQGQHSFVEFSSSGNWQHIHCSGKSRYDQGYLIVEMNRTDSSTRLRCDDVYVYAEDDDAAFANLRVGLGVDEASADQSSNRQVVYSLQNVKDALMELTRLDEDNFDFEFTYDRKFNIYARKGNDKLGLSIVYPGNIDNMSIQRSASNVANKIINIGSGIGDERLQYSVINSDSGAEIGTRESIITNSNVSLKQTLMSQAVMELFDRKDPTNLPTITIRDGSIHPGIVGTGDNIFLQIQNDSYLSTASGEYKIVKLAVDVDENSVETVKLTLEKPDSGPEIQWVRYIRSALNGNSVNSGNHWVQVQALMLVGNDYENIAYGKTVYSSGDTGSGYLDITRVTNGNLDTNNYYDPNRSGLQAVTIDLGAEYPIDYIKVFPFYGDERAYYGNTVSVGTTLPDGLNGTSPLENVLWENFNVTCTSDGIKSIWVQDKSVREPKKEVIRKVRYIKEYIKGSSANTGNHWVEIMALEEQPNGTFIDRAIGATVSGSTTINNPQYVVNNNVNTNQYSSCDGTNGNSIIIDLGAEYPIDYIKLWHYYGDYRTYNDSTLSVGTKLVEGNDPLETIVWKYDGPGWVETSEGIVSPWIQGF